MFMFCCYPCPWTSNANYSIVLFSTVVIPTIEKKGRASMKSVTSLILLCAVLSGCGSIPVQAETGLVLSGPPPIGVSITRVNRFGGAYKTIYRADGTMRSELRVSNNCGFRIPCSDEGRWSVELRGEGPVLCTQYDHWDDGAKQCGYMQVSPPQGPTGQPVAGR